MIQRLEFDSVGTAALLDYGRCPCSGVFEHRTREVSLTAGKQPIVITHVPQGACPLCGSQVYKADILERIEALYRVSSMGKAD
jgi:YgiT-type zinc finger domain-containing protein